MAKHSMDRLEDLFLRAIELEPQEREAHLLESCKGQEELLAQLRSLLEAHERAASVVDVGLPSGDSSLTPERALQIGRRVAEQIGGLEVTELLGQGGMGMVFLARQVNPDRLVALKVIRPGIASRSLLARFAHEARVLAHMQSEWIARIYEAGTVDTGEGEQPYFVMEYVRGEPLLEFAKSQRLETGARLALLACICDAVQHAHQKGVVHRDLKPDNILITSEGQPKILDFGVARATGSDLRLTSLRTNVGQLIGTVPYMSPEQAAGDPDLVDTRSDVYALGVLGYELLSGQLPYDLSQKVIHEAVRIIREEEPSRLGSVSGTFRGDVETIIGRALEKDPERRYASAADLAQDLRRDLNHEPIMARPASVVYQLRKFAQRNRSLVVGTAATLVALIGGLLGTITYAMGETEQRNLAELREQEGKAARARAELNFQHARDAVDRMLTLVGAETLVDVPQMEGIRRELLREALSFYQRFLSEEGDDPEIRFETARAHSRVATIHNTLGELSSAESSGQRAVELFAELSSEFESNSNYRLREALALRYSAVLCQAQGKYDSAEAHYREAVELLDQMLDNDPQNKQILRERGWTLCELGMLFVDRDRVDEALLHLREGLDQLGSIWSEDVSESSPDAKDILAKAHMSFGVGLKRSGDLIMARDVTRRAVVLFEELHEAFPASPSYASSLAGCYSNLGAVLDDLRDSEGVVQSLELAIGINEELVGDFPESHIYRHLLGASLVNLGAHYQLLEDLTRAEDLYARSAEVVEELVRRVPDIPAYTRMLADLYNNMGMLQRDTQRPDLAEVKLRESARLYQELAEAYPDDASYRLDAYTMLSVLGRLLFNQGFETQDFDAAIIAYREAFEFRESLPPGYDDEEDHVHAYGDGLHRLGDMLIVQKAWEEAHDVLTRSYDIRDQLAGGHVGDPHFEADLAQTANALAWVKTVADDIPAIHDVRGAVELGELATSLQPERAANWNVLGLAYYRDGQWENSVEALEQSIALGSATESQDHSFLAMALWRLDRKQEAREHQSRSLQSENAEFFLEDQQEVEALFRGDDLEADD